jgi:GR25 family glycosyltransferase involved in LPS biosynthesis
MKAAQWRFTVMRLSATDGKLLDDNPSLVSPRDVALQWNPAVNALFDPRCLALPATASGAIQLIDMSNAERACAMSHLRIWRTIQQLHSYTNRASSKSPSQSRPIEQDLFTMLHHHASLHVELLHGFYLICEDDINIHRHRLLSVNVKNVNNVFATYQHNLLQELTYLTARIPADADVVYLGAVLPRFSPHFIAKPCCNGLLTRVNYAWHLHAYLLRASSAQKILKQLPVNMPVDNFLATLAYGEVIKVSLATTVYASSSE